jgi:hypothetical protein
MAKGIAKTIRKEPNTDNFVFREQYEANKHKKKKKSAKEPQRFSAEAMAILGYSKADVKLKQAIGR